MINLGAKRGTRSMTSGSTRIRITLLRSLLCATTVTLLAQSGSLAQESVWSAYFEVGNKFYEEKEYAKAAQLLVDAAKEAERLIGSKERLLKCLPILNRVYIAEGKTELAQQVNDRIQTLGGTTINQDGVRTTGAIAGETPPALPIETNDSNKTQVANKQPDKKLEFTVETGTPKRKEIQADEGRTDEDPPPVTASSSSTPTVPTSKDDPEGKGLITEKEDRKKIALGGGGLVGEFRADTRVQKAIEALKLKGHCAWSKSVDVSDDGTRAITGSIDNTVRVWDLSTGKEIARLDGHEHHVNAVAFSPAGNTALSGSTDLTARLWDIDAGTEIKQFKGHTNIITCVAFAPGGARVATGSYDGTVRIWDALTGKELQKLDCGLDNIVKCIAYTPEGDMLASAGKDKLITLWRLRDGTAIRKFSGHKHEITGIDISPDGSKILSISRDLTIRLWDLDSGDELKCMIGHGDWIQKAVFISADKAVSGGLDKTLRVWNLDEGKETKAFTTGAYGMFSIDFSKDGGLALTGSDDFAFRLWKLAP